MVTFRSVKKAGAQGSVDQGAAGTANWLVSVNAALPSGTNNIGDTDVATQVIDVGTQETETIITGDGVTTDFQLKGAGTANRKFRIRAIVSINQDAGTYPGTVSLAILRSGVTFYYARGLTFPTSQNGVFNFRENSPSYGGTTETLRVIFGSAVPSGLRIAFNVLEENERMENTNGGP